MISSPYEYIEAMERLGLFAAHARIPEHNVTVWRVYLEMYRSHIGGTQDIQIIHTPEGLGFYKDPLDERDTYTWALLGALCHPIVPLSPPRLVESAGTILETFARAGIPRPSIVTETFEMTGRQEHELPGCFLWLNSPRARIHDGFDTYVSSLSSSRRQELRRLFDRFTEREGFQFELSDRTPNAKELDFILDNLQRRWGARDMSYALVQNLWPIAVSTVLPDRARFMRVYCKGALAFLNAFIVRDEVIISQSTCKNAELSVNGLGIAIDFKTIQLLSRHDSPIRHLDPTCRMSVSDDSPDIAIAKRKVVNEDACKPTLLAGHDLPALDLPYPYLDPVRGWVVPEGRAVIGKPA